MSGKRMALLLLGLLVGCAGPGGGMIRIDGSSTVYPISLAMAEEFTIDNPNSPVSVGFSGTGGGLSKLCVGEIDVANASRVVSRGELERCAANGVELFELPVAADAITVVVNRANEFASCLTLSELHDIWEPDSQVTNWSQVRPGFPDAPIILYGPGTDSGTFDFFTEAVNGETGAVRTDFFPSEDDNVLVHGVESDRYALGFFGYAYYAENSERLRAVAIDSGVGCVAPSPTTIESNDYAPLARPLLIYMSSEALDEKPALADFVDYYLAAENRGLIADSGYVPYPDEVYQAVQERFAARVTGTAFEGFEPGDSVIEAVRRRE